MIKRLLAPGLTPEPAMRYYILEKDITLNFYSFYSTFIAIEQGWKKCYRANTRVFVNGGIKVKAPSVVRL